MQKKYSDYMKEITPDELYYRFLAHGLFTEKLPPFLTSVNFFDYCQNLSTPFLKKATQYIYYESMRNINIPRQLGIPNPFAYQNLCSCLRDNWYNLCKFFEEKTINHSYKISQIHIRKRQKKLSLFEMNYKNWKLDNDPIPDLMIGKKYLVKADISNCFPSIYTHAIPWAIVGKDKAKLERSQSEWYNQIDKNTQNIKFGETHGLLIGPHASNLLSEIVLTRVDMELYNKGWKYVRNIDDYKCYVSSYEKGQKFLIDLAEVLRYYDLTLNHKKTEILELPLASSESWVRQLNILLVGFNKDIVNYKMAGSFFDSVIEIMFNNNKDSAILNYAIKAIGSCKLTKNAIEYSIKTVLHLAILFPYLVPLLDAYIFQPFSIRHDEIVRFSNIIFQKGKKTVNYEAMSYAIFFAIKYNFEISALTADVVIQCNDCIVALIGYIYFSRKKDKKMIMLLKDYAKQLIKTNEYASQWLFVYEILSKTDLKEDWKPLKQAKISFIMGNI